FDTLAKKYHDYASKEETALLSPFPRDSLPPSYQAGFAGKKAGDIVTFTIPTSTDIPKFVVARLETIEEGGAYTLADMRERIRSDLAQRAALRRFIDTLKKQTYVSMRIDTSDAAPTKP